MTAIAEQVLPHSLDAEKSVLGAILLRPEAIQDAEGALEPKHFFRRAHQVLYHHMLALAEKQVAIDFLTLKDALLAAGQLDDIGGPSYLAALTDGVPRSTNLDHYAHIVREKAHLRALIAGANRMIVRAYAADGDATEILTDAEKELIGLADRTIARGFESARSIAPRVLDYLESVYHRRASVTGVPTGFIELDELTRGLQPGTLITVGARPGVGKSSLLSNIVQNAALSNFKGAYFSLEMGKVELFIRQVSSLARIDSHRLQTGFIGERDWGRISQAIGELSEASFHIDDTPAVSLLEVRSRARRLKTEHGLDLLAIDYLQLMTPSQRMNNRALEVGTITAALKALSMELRIPILIASQLSRDPEKRGGRPKLSDLRDSGSIEQDSDIVMFLHRDEEKPEAPTELIIAKHRNGDTGTIKLAWFKQETRYDTYAPTPTTVDQRLPMGDR